MLPADFQHAYLSDSRLYVTEGNQLALTFVFALIVIYLVLAAQFESLRDPFVILVSVPMSICGALLPLFFGLGTLNIYTQIGLVTLIGLISKHGILMVEFANELQRNEGLDRRAAIERAARVRLRPILMTTAAMVVGLFPLLAAAGAGAASRFAIGLVIVSGMLIGTLFTLFVLPAVYTMLAADHRPATSAGAPRSWRRSPDAAVLPSPSACPKVAGMIVRPDDPVAAAAGQGVAWHHFGRAARSRMPLGPATAALGDAVDGGYLTVPADGCCCR